MLNNDHLRELSDRLSRLVPAAEELRIEARTKIEQALKQSLSEMGMLTKEEFDAQARALRRAEDRIEELEKVISKLEETISQRSSESSAE